jgi:predicted lysophospholipase L1 biosynthesis ABC-type transport system permease subunit
VGDVTDPTPLDKAEAAVRDAAANTDVVRIVAAVLATQQATHQQPTPIAQQATQVARRPVGLYVAAGIGGAVALTFLAMAAALLAVAVAVGGVCATVCLLVLKSLLNDYQKGR